MKQAAIDTVTLKIAITSFSIPRIAILFMLMANCSTGKTQCVSDSVKIDCGNAPLFFERQQYDTGHQFAIIHVHENETTALQAAVWLMDSLRQGSITSWHGQQNRVINFSVGSQSFRFDPNRIYTETGIHSTLGANATDTAFLLVQAVADTFLQQYIKSKSVVIAVHNNTDKGGLSINSYQKGGSYFQDAKTVYSNPLLDADDFFYTTEESYFRYLKSKRYNVVLQNNEQVTDDGSLSVFCAHSGIRYINVEAQNGHFRQQLEMLNVIWELLSAERKQPSGSFQDSEMN